MLNKGYTVIELLVALLLFGIVITSAVSIVVSAIQASRKSAAAQNIEDNARAIFESMIREIRTGSDYEIAANGRRLCFLAAGTSASPAAFVEYQLVDGVARRRSVDPSDESCPNLNDSNSSALNSNDIFVEALRFFGNFEDKAPSGLQPQVTIFMTMGNNDEPNLRPVNLQMTISSRSYQ